MESSDFSSAGATAGGNDGMGTAGSTNNALAGADIGTEQSGGLADVVES